MKTSSKAGRETHTHVNNKDKKKVNKLKKLKSNQCKNTLIHEDYLRKISFISNDKWTHVYGQIIKNYRKDCYEV